MSTLKIRRLVSIDQEFSAQLSELIAWDEISDSSIVSVVEDVLSNVREKGDEALIDYTNQFDHRAVSSAEELCIQESEIAAAAEQIPEEQFSAMREAAARIRLYHEHQIQDSWNYHDDAGTLLGQQITPIERVGIYVPGGKAAYPSTVLMNTIPASVAGVNEIVMVSPAPKGEINPVVLAAAHVAGVNKIITVGGAQAVAALAYGTDTVPKVDKIVGPGNIYVATAKKMLFGQVGLDMLAGPSEILIICDGKTDPDWIAMDLFSQAEHDELAQAILIGIDAEYLQQVEASINKLLIKMERANIIRASLENRGALILAKDLDDGINIANRIAPEHLELSFDDAESWLPKVKNAGAIFVGRYTPESVGDYCAGPNHVLPTSATARFSSPLGVYDFQKRSSVIGCSRKGSSELGKLASILARSESLTAHAQSAEFRILKDS